MKKLVNTARVAPPDGRLPREEGYELSRRGFVLPVKPVTNAQSARRSQAERAGDGETSKGPPLPLRDIKISAESGAEGPALPRFQDFSCRPYTLRSVFKPLPPEEQTYVKELPEAAAQALDGDIASGLAALQRGDEVRLPTGIMAEVVGASYQPLPEGTQVAGAHVTEWRMWAKTKRFREAAKEKYLPLDPRLPTVDGESQIKYKKTRDAKKILKEIQDAKNKWTPYGEQDPPPFELSSRPAAIATRCGHGARPRAAQGTGGALETTGRASGTTNIGATHLPSVPSPRALYARAPPALTASTAPPTSSRRTCSLSSESTFPHSDTSHAKK